ncbi:hypothetical protein PLICRDRAFT_49017 [Plicaturopsis crispa FD-325 SS-3]|nr:hypothetical protein PLICRDRAFT_49017 [Plicaturopsis crispa FD-325 SS-3]
MARWSLFARLPASLLCASLALVAAAAPVELKTLNPDNFNETVSTGVWFIEHFSPYCHHCRDFAPTWDKLVEENEASANPGIHLAQVNCAMHGDLCDANNVKGYPQMNLYRNGEFVETFKQPRELDIVREFLAAHAEPTTTVKAAPETATHTAGNGVLRIQTARASVNPSGSVLPLTADTLKEAIDQGPIFIKYFAPWCGHCKKLAPTWKQLARHMQNKLTIAEVNCDDYSSACKSEGIQGFPMLSYYSNGVKTEYTGSRKLDQLKAFTEKATAPAVQELVPTEFEERIGENDVVYVLLHEVGQSDAVDQVNQAAGVLLGHPPVYTSSSADLRQRFSEYSKSSPVLLVFKDGDVTSPVASYDFTGVPLKEWLLDNRLPTITELTQESFQSVMNAPNKPLVAIAAVTTETRARVADKLTEIAKKWRLTKSAAGSRPVVFAYMDADKWAKWLKSMYGLTSSAEDAVVVADHGRLVYYDLDERGHPLKLTSTSVFSALQGAAKGTIVPKHSENLVERLARWANQKVLGIETYIVNHPFHLVFFLVGTIALIILGMRRAMADDVEDIRERRYNRKSNRLD